MFSLSTFAPRREFGHTRGVPVILRRNNMGSWWKRNWRLAIAIAGVIALVAIGVGFIPVTRTHTVAYSCTRTEQYDCVQTRSVQREYTTTEERALAYTASGAGYNESWWDCDIWMWINVKNTDTEGGYFTVNFQCSTDVYGGWYTQSQTNYLSPNGSAEFKVEFQRSCGTPWQQRDPQVVPDTKTVVVTKTRTEQEPYNATCTREVPDTCYREEKEHEWLYWPK
jgi:hypothetical protein